MENKKMSKGDKAKQLFLEGYTCSQSVIKAFENEDWFVSSHIDADTLLKISSSFGGGMGRLREVCGTVSAMFMLLGLKQGFFKPKAEEKASHYQCVQDLAALFKAENGSIVCRDLLGLCKSNANKENDSHNASGINDVTNTSDVVKGDPFSATPEERTAEYYKKRPCADLCKSAANILEQYLNG